MKKWKTIILLTLSVHIMPLLGLNMLENGMDIKDTFRIYVTKPLKL
ncbi:MAG: hypothetical protein GX895_04135 [Clostridiales bacterium]|nr:hypothetical protein [Clostridium sp. N3C]NLZ47968.1 hypothetical protein [Clostridiales bacterium]SCN23469.1 hypothetical protein N3C_1315 [Clostridium sp. N3C]